MNTVLLHLTRRVKLAILAALVVAAVLVTVGTADAAVVNGYVQHTWTGAPVADCSVKVGTVYNDPNGPAQAGADVVCSHFHSHISATVTLWRRVTTSSPWQAVRTSGWYTAANNYALTVWTGQYHGGGSALWDEIATVNVDGYQQSFDVGRFIPYQPYTPLS